MKPIHFGLFIRVISALFHPIYKQQGPTPGVADGRWSNLTSIFFRWAVQVLCVQIHVWFVHLHLYHYWILWDTVCIYIIYIYCTQYTPYMQIVVYVWLAQQTSCPCLYTYQVCSLSYFLFGIDMPFRVTKFHVWLQTGMYIYIYYNVLIGYS